MICSALSKQQAVSPDTSRAQLLEPYSPGGEQTMNTMEVLTLLLLLVSVAKGVFSITWKITNDKKK